MSKQKKKRNKKYRGADAADAPARVIRVDAKKRSKAELWWLDKKRVIKPVAIALAVIALIIWLLVALIQVIF